MAEVFAKVRRPIGAHITSHRLPVSDPLVSFLFNFLLEGQIKVINKLGTELVQSLVPESMRATLACANSDPLDTLAAAADRIYEIHVWPMVGKASCDTSNHVMGNRKYRSILVPSKVRKKIIKCIIPCTFTPKKTGLDYGYPKWSTSPNNLRPLEPVLLPC